MTALVDGQVTAKFLLGRRRDQMDSDDIAALERSVSAIRDLPTRRTLIRAGEPVVESTLLLDGILCRYMDDRAGHRQLVAIHVPGDFVDLHGFPMGRLDHDIATIGPVKVAVWKHGALEDILAPRPKLQRMLWFSTLLDAAMHREWIFRLGRLGADGRVAHLICELEERLAMVGLSRGGTYGLPLIQADLAEACGLTNVHVNRVLRALREQELMTFRDGRVTIFNRPQLRALGEFEPGYLYGNHPEKVAEALAGAA